MQASALAGSGLLLIHYGRTIRGSFSTHRELDRDESQSSQSYFRKPRQGSEPVTMKSAI